MDKPAPSPLTLAERRRLLGSVPLFSGFAPKLIDELAAAARERNPEPSEALFQAGETSDEMFLIVEGTLEVSLKRGGKRIELTRLGPGDLCGEMALLTGEPRSATVSAATACRVLELDRATMARLFHRQPELMEALSRNLVARKRSNASTLREAESKPIQRPKQTPEAHVGLLDQMRKWFGAGR